MVQLGIQALIRDYGGLIVSAGNLIGSIWNTLLAAGIWIVLGAVFDKLFIAFNFTMKMLPSMQDALNGFSIMQTIWSVLLIIIFFVIWLNYLFNENSQASGGV